MKRLLLVPLALLLAACESSNTIPTRKIPAGQEVSCVGLANDAGDRVPGVKYEVSTRNIVVGILFAEMIAPPAFVLLEELKCPVRDTTLTR